MVEPETPFELLLGLALQPVATSANEAAATRAADNLVRRENFTVTPLCAWIGEVFESAPWFVRALSQDRANTKYRSSVLSRHFWERSQIVSKPDRRGPFSPPFVYFLPTGSGSGSGTTTWIRPVVVSGARP